MKGTFFDNLDIELFLTQQEFDALPKQDAEKKFKSLECMLKNVDGSDFGRKACIQCEESLKAYFSESGDGIEVNYKDETYFVKINEHASEFIDKRGHFGTRYGMGEKITIYISERKIEPPMT